MTGEEAIEYLKRADTTVGKKIKTKTAEAIDIAVKALKEPKIGYCKDCKWWKDSDGAFKRGIGAESQCPINRKEVYDGNGYCFLFEKKEGIEIVCGGAS